MKSNDSSNNRCKKKQKTNECLDNYRSKCLLFSKWRGMVNAKINKAAPYFFFLTGVKDLMSTYDEDLTITFPELLDSSLGTLEHSLHINFMVEFPWLMAQYAINDINNPSMTILYGVDNDDLRRIPSHLKVTAIKVKSPYPFGHHHTKMSIFFYTDCSVRFAVYTANLIESDWEDRTQGIWISPKCPYLGDGIPINYGESETLFKVDVLHYLNFYHLPELRNWLIRIQKSNCSSIRVCFVASVPGEQGNSYGYLKLSKLIKEHSSDLEKTNWNLIFQCSSIGSLGQTADSWLLGEFVRNLEQNSKAVHEVSIIYPSVENVTRSIYGMLGGACLPYSSKTHQRQLWLNKFLMQWKSNSRYRSQAVPHLKTYAKISCNGKELAWFLVTSANLSKAAWGKCNKAGLIRIMSYEAGVAFFPQFFTGKKVFTINERGYTTPSEEGFPLPYDLPLTRYNSTDEVFLYDKHFPL